MLCICWEDIQVTAPLWRPEDSFVESVLCFYLYKGLGIEYRSLDLHTKCLYPLHCLLGSLFNF